MSQGAPTETPPPDVRARRRVDRRSPWVWGAILVALACAGCPRKLALLEDELADAGHDQAGDDDDDDDDDVMTPDGGPGDGGPLDGGPDDAGPPDGGGPPPPASCEDDGLTEATLCVGSGEGRAGGTVTVTVELGLPSDCSSGGQMNGVLAIDDTVLSLENPVTGVCLNRNQDGAQVIWNQRTAGAGVDCPVSYPRGTQDSLRFRIAEDAPVGAVDLTWTTAFVNAEELDPDSCSGFGSIDGRIFIDP
ncbi:MAG TPA: hypothetical protein RMF84_00195 [Polyangiaceae bacterium LLY-WYZ-14_1]|nr:hypothetical protein [Polyangiaceae bacterium LLY-WYZ-14_1]